MDSAVAVRPFCPNCDLGSTERAQPQGMASPSGTVFIIQGDREYGINQTLRDWNQFTALELV